MLENFIVICLSLIILLMVALVIYLSRLHKTNSLQLRSVLAETHSEGLRKAGESVAKIVGESIRTLDQNIGQQLSMQKNAMDSTHKVVNKVSEQLGALGESTQKIREIGKDLRSLQDVLQAPKLRGTFGEFLLEDVLRSMLPHDHIEIPSMFKDGSRADAAILLGGKRIPIDSKFPLEAFQRMLCQEDEVATNEAKKEFVRSLYLRIDEITDKYIHTEENTFGFALMYLPSEAIYYEVVIRQMEVGGRSPLQYALEKKVVPVSPNSLYAYLATIAFGLRGLQIEKEAEQIRGRVAQLQRQFENFIKVLYGIERNFELVNKKFEEALGKGKRLHTRMSHITGAQEEIEGSLESQEEESSYELPS